MSSQIEICNLALGNIRAASINDINESSIEAQTCKQRFQQAVDFLLRDHPWRFAFKTRALSLVTDEPVAWAYAYNYPTDCLKALYLLPEMDVSSDRTVLYHSDIAGAEFVNRNRVDFEMMQGADGGRILVTNQANAYLAYTAKQTDPSRFDPHFVEALSWYLGAMIAIPVIGSETGREMRKEAFKIYQEVLPVAQASDANEQHGKARVPESPSITERA